MATLDTVSIGDVSSAAKFNKAINAWTNILGVTDDAQVNLGRLPLPWLTADPTLANGLAWIRSNLGAAGRLYIRQSGVTVPYLPYRQRQRSAVLASTFQNTSSSYADVPGLTLNLTTTGGRLRIIIISDTIGFTGGMVHIQSSSGVGGTGDLRAVVGSQNLSPLFINHAEASALLPTTNFPCTAFQWWDYQPAAGTYTVKIQARCLSGTGIGVSQGCALLVEEYGD